MTHVHTHSHTLTCTPTHTTHGHTYTHIHTPHHTCTHIHTHSHTHIHTHTYMYTHTHTRTFTHTLTHTQTHTHTHLCQRHVGNIEGVWGQPLEETMLSSFIGRLPTHSRWRHPHGNRRLNRGSRRDIDCVWRVPSPHRLPLNGRQTWSKTCGNL